jgi:formylmethanofuran dehydrogenase subunit D
MTEQKTYLVEELFEDIPGDPDNVLFKIPPELCEKLGWKEGDNIHISAAEGRIIISKA